MKGRPEVTFKGTAKEKISINSVNLMCNNSIVNGGKVTTYDKLYSEVKIYSNVVTYDNITASWSYIGYNRYIPTVPEYHIKTIKKEVFLVKGNNTVYLYSFGYDGMHTGWYKLTVKSEKGGSSKSAYVYIEASTNVPVNSVSFNSLILEDGNRESCNNIVALPGTSVHVILYVNSEVSGTLPVCVIYTRTPISKRFTKEYNIHAGLNKLVLPDVTEFMGYGNYTIKVYVGCKSGNTYKWYRFDEGGCYVYFPEIHVKVTSVKFKVTGNLDLNGNLYSNPTVNDGSTDNTIEVVGSP
ncbi:MAG: hypothetical protein DSY33_00510, partial [Archaeoglobus sp.]